MSTGYPEPGELVGPFQVGDRLGVGGMGIVFRARDTQLNRDIALKVIAPHLSGDPDFQARFVREARAQASLDSAHVVQVYTFGEEGGRLYIASQLIPDGDLGQMLKRHGVPPARIALDVIAQVADGLADAHATGLVHRDIKPANVLLRKRVGSLQAYLGDFGIARQAGRPRLTQAGGTVGTPSYMAPELHVGGDAGVSPTSTRSAACSGRRSAAPHRTPPTATTRSCTAHMESRCRNWRRPARWPPRSTGSCAPPSPRARAALPSAAAMRDDLSGSRGCPTTRTRRPDAGVVGPDGPAWP